MPTESIQALEPIKANITWLNLGNTGIKDEALAIIGQCENLTRLRLENNTTFTDAGIAQLKGLKHLSSLNLYGTAISDEALTAIQEMSGLKKLFLWQTEVSKEAVEALQNARPDMDIDVGFEFAQNTDGEETND